MKKALKRQIMTHMDENGIVVFRLLEGKKKLKAIHTFGYGTCHGLWLRINYHQRGLVSMTTESASVIKETIASWQSERETIAGS